MFEAIQFEAREAGKRANPAAAAAAARRELRHFETCPMCGQSVDRRDIYAVMHHLPVGHAPIPVN